MFTSVDSRQLALALDDLRLKIPWSGRSPRDLTKGASALFLRRGPSKSASGPVATEQCDLWPSWSEGPLYEGAPSLLPFLRKDL